MKISAIAMGYFIAIVCFLGVWAIAGDVGWLEIPTAIGLGFLGLLAAAFVIRRTSA